MNCSVECGGWNASGNFYTTQNRHTLRAPHSTLRAPCSTPTLHTHTPSSKVYSSQFTVHSLHHTPMRHSNTPHGLCPCFVVLKYRSRRLFFRAGNLALIKVTGRCVEVRSRIPIYTLSPSRLICTLNICSRCDVCRVVCRVSR